MLASGRKLSGCTEVTTLDGLEVEEAMFFHRRKTGELLMQQEASHFFDPRSRLEKLLRMRAQEAFPARYTLRVPLQGERELHRGELTDFWRPT